MRNLILLALAASLLTGCNQQKQSKEDLPFQLEGSVEGVQNAKLVVTDYETRATDTIAIEDGKFVISGDYPTPTKLVLNIQGAEPMWYLDVFAENSKMTLKSRLATQEEASKFIKPETTITGGEFQKEYEKYNKEEREFTGSILKKGYPDNFRDTVLYFVGQYIKKNPQSPVPAYIICSKATSRDHGGGAPAKKLKKLADLISPSLAKHPSVIQMNRQLESMLATEAGLNAFMKGVEDVKYKVDDTFNGSEFKNMRYLSIFNNNDLCMIHSTNSVLSDLLFGNEKEPDFKICIANNQGEKLKEFAFKEKGTPAALAVDENDLIYVMASQKVIQKAKSRGRSISKVKNNGVICFVFNRDGKKLKEWKLDELNKATGAKIHKGNLIVSDSETRRLGVYSKETGALESKVDDMRTCCGILDFDVDSKGNLLVANLGSFRVDVYNFKGEKSVSFGHRGQTINDFHGCCNPVSVKKLKGGAVITVEKSPTRIKVYTSAGAKTIAGVDELVKGCEYIPVTSDDKDNIYLASPEKGLVKCIKAI
jgi:hypothetical protein